MITYRPRPKYSNILPHCHFVTTDLTWTGKQSKHSFVGQTDPANYDTTFTRSVGTSQSALRNDPEDATITFLGC